MSILDAPLALLDRVIARHDPGRTKPDDPVARMVARTGSPSAADVWLPAAGCAAMC